MKYYEKSKNIEGDNFGGWAITEQMFNWIIENIPTGSTILELGSGTGTIELSKHYNMISIEHNDEWIGLCDKSNYIYAPLVDVILIDGPPKKYSERIDFIKNINLFKKDVIFLLDDTQRDGEMELCKSLSNLLNKEYKIIEGDKNFAIIKNN